MFGRGPTPCPLVRPTPPLDATHATRRGLPQHRSARQGGSQGRMAASVPQPRQNRRRPRRPSQVPSRREGLRAHPPEPGYVGSRKKATPSERACSPRLQPRRASPTCQPLLSPTRKAQGQSEGEWTRGPGRCALAQSGGTLDRPEGAEGSSPQTDASRRVHTRHEEGRRRDRGCRGTGHMPQSTWGRRATCGGRCEGVQPQRPPPQRAPRALSNRKA
mmetsp:Transcript_34838/g.69471  ORF Transcript_34838/g.69471 Transcript_34838/m.69471 type:complete len:217 (-) Transcript_34838:1033-1683(-)